MQAFDVIELPASESDDEAVVTKPKRIEHRPVDPHEAEAINAAAKISERPKKRRGALLGDGTVRTMPDARRKRHAPTLQEKLEKAKKEGKAVEKESTKANPIPTAQEESKPEPKNASSPSPPSNKNKRKGKNKKKKEHKEKDSEPSAFAKEKAVNDKSQAETNEPNNKEDNTSKTEKDPKSDEQNEQTKNDKNAQGNETIGNKEVSEQSQQNGESVKANNDNDAQSNDKDEHNEETEQDEKKDKDVKQKNDENVSAKENSLAPQKSDFVKNESSKGQNDSLDGANNGSSDSPDDNIISQNDSQIADDNEVAPNIDLTDTEKWDEQIDKTLQEVKNSTDVYDKRQLFNPVSDEERKLNEMAIKSILDGSFDEKLISL